MERLGVRPCHCRLPWEDEAVQDPGTLVPEPYRKVVPVFQAFLGCTAQEEEKDVQPHFKAIPGCIDFHFSKPSWHDTASKPLRLRFQAMKKMCNCPQEIANMVESVWIASQVETSAILPSAKDSFAFFVTLPVLVVDEILESNC